MTTVSELALSFQKKYPMTVARRIKKNARVVETHLNPGEVPLFAFAAQKNNNFLDFFQTAVVTLTNQRILIGRKRAIVGYFLDAITPDLFNDLKVISGLFWGKIEIDTVKEEVFLSNIDKKALAEIETRITSYMMEEKKKYPEKKSIQ